MEIGSEILIRAKVINLDSNPHGSSIKVEVKGFGPLHSSVAPNDKEQFWIHRVDIPEVVVAELPPKIDPCTLGFCSAKNCELMVRIEPECKYAEFERKFEGRVFVGRDRCKKKKELLEQAGD